MGNVRKRGKIWHIDYCYLGKRIRKRIGPSKQLAELALKDLELKIAKGELDFLQRDSDLNKLFREFSKYSETNHSPSTIKRYKAVLDNFKGFLKEEYPHLSKASHVIPAVFEDYKAYRKKQEAESKTINIELQVLKTMFSLALKWGHTSNNPAHSVIMLRIIKKTEPRFLTEEECEKLLSTCGEWLYSIFYTFLNTGMRKQELMHLEWSDVDFDRRIIKIKSKDHWTPKTAERNIPIGNGLLTLLREHKEKTRQSKLVFHYDTGNKIGDNKLRKELMKITKKCGFPDITKLHTLRHTFASHLVMKGVDLPTVSKLLGHSNIATTMIYSHLAPKHLTDAVDKLNF